MAKYSSEQVSQIIGARLLFLAYAVLLLLVMVVVGRVGFDKNFFFLCFKKNASIENFIWMLLHTV